VKETAHGIKCPAVGQAVQPSQCAVQVYGGVPCARANAVNKRVAGMAAVTGLSMPSHGARRKERQRCCNATGEIQRKIGLQQYN